MSILKYFTHYVEDDNEKTFKKKLNDHVKAEKINLLEYSYLRGYTGSIINSSWFIDLLNKLDDKEMIKICLDMFKIFTKNDEKIQVDIVTIMNDMIESKADTINFTYDQKKGLNSMFEFLINKEKKMYGLYGYAGTGKTTTLVEFISHLLDANIIKSVIFTAPTNKAVTVIKSKFRRYAKRLYEKVSNKIIDDNFDYENIIDRLREYEIKIDFVTIHKLLQFKQDFNTEGDIVFIRNGNSMIDLYELVVVDECSMIPLSIIDNIIDEIIKKSSSIDNYEKSPKVLYAGDPAQLPPVDEKTSSIFKINDITLNEYTRLLSGNDNSGKDYRAQELKNRYDRFIQALHTIESTTLKEVVRSKNDSVVGVCSATRKWVIENIAMPEIKQYLNKGAYFYKYVNGLKTESKWFKKCLNSFKTGNDCNIIITWTNRQCDEYNDVIRRTLFNKNVDKFEIGDILMLNDFYNIGDGRRGKSDESKFYTSEQIKVVKIEKNVKKIDNFSTLMSKDSRKLKSYSYFEKKYKPFTETINKDTKRVYKSWKLTVQRVELKESQQNNETYTIYVVDDNDAELLTQEKSYVANRIKKFRLHMVASLPTKIKQIDEHVIKPLWREWHKLFVETFANISYGYAITCHKGQGSNFYNVYVDAHDIFQNPRIDEMKRCLYTAMTRTSNELHVLI